MKRGDFYWLGALCAVTAVYAIPSSRQVAMAVTASHPYLMGFVKFAILASMGELIAIRIALRTWKAPLGFPWKVLVWGIIGVIVTLMFELFSSGVRGAIAKGLLWPGPAAIQNLGTAFLISSSMNLVFAPVFMTAHRFTDTFIDMRALAGRHTPAPSLATLISRIDWNSLIGFVILKTIPFFWIPAHTLVFLLPPEFRIIASAYLSVVLGVILSVAKTRQRK